MPEIILNIVIPLLFETTVQIIAALTVMVMVYIGKRIFKKQD